MMSSNSALLFISTPGISLEPLTRGKQNRFSTGGGGIFSKESWSFCAIKAIYRLPRRLGELLGTAEKLVVDVYDCLHTRIFSSNKAIVKSAIPY